MDMPILRPIPYKKDNTIKTLMSFTRRWEVVEDWSVDVFGCGTVVIPRGFTFDGASIPKVFRNILSPVGILMIPGIVHDFCYAHHYLCVKIINREIVKCKIKKWEADLIFLKTANRVNGLRFINNIAYWAIKRFGQSAWDGK